MKASHLKAAHEDVERLATRRQTIPPPPGLHDYKAILHAHAEDSAHTGGTRAEMLADARKAGISVVMLSDHLRPPKDFIRDSWRGLHDGVLFIPGSEARGFLVYPTHSIMDRMDQPVPQLIASVTESNGLIFLSHAEERLNHPMDGLHGMEIYNRHADAKKDVMALLAIAAMLTDTNEFAQLSDNLRRYPDEMFAAQVGCLPDYLAKWDEGTQSRRLTGVAANDCHHNMVFVVKMVDGETVQIGTIVDKDSDLRKVSANTRPGIRAMTQGHKPGDVLAKADFDPYYISFRDSATHILAPELTESAIRKALLQGHAYVSHDWMCDATGFAFSTSPPNGAIMGDEVKLADCKKVIARFPAPCHIRLIRNGQVMAEAQGDQIEQAISEPGVYRVEGWLELDKEERPWVYSNPIYIR